MDVLFFLIRLPFFVAGLLLYVAVAIVAADVGLIIGSVILFLGVPVWVCVLLPGAFLSAAFSNDAKVLSRFLMWTRDDVIGERAKWMRRTIADYLRGYRELWEWLIGAKQS